MSGTVKVQLLDFHKGPFTFYIQRDEDGYIISIPGHGGGRDGPKFPDKVEQEKWMRTHSHMKEIWYLTWKCKDREKLHQFLKKIGSKKRF